MNKFKVTIPCKPYVRHFLILNFGDPADISKDNGLYDFFRSKLEKKSFRRDGSYPNFGKLSSEIDIKISRDVFYRHGWELSKTDIVTFNRMVEGKVKTLLYSIVGSKIAFGMPLTDAIDHFQDKFSFSEEIWPKESIYKDCQRNLSIEKNQIYDEISKITDEICLDKLSANRTTCHNLKKKI